MAVLVVASAIVALFTSKLNLAQNFCTRRRKEKKNTTTIVNKKKWCVMKMCDTLTDEQMEKDLKEYFSNGGTNSLREIRLMLEKKYNCSLQSEKDRIKRIAQEIVEEHDNDGNDNDSDAEEEKGKVQSTKTTQSNNKKRKLLSNIKLEGEEEEEKSNKKAKTSSNKNQSSSAGMPVWKTGENGERYIALSKNKRISITCFKGKSYVNIREYYEKDGKLLPTKKGIALDDIAWRLLKENVEAIDGEFQKNSR